MKSFDLKREDFKTENEFYREKLKLMEQEIREQEQIRQERKPKAEKCFGCPHRDGCALLRFSYETRETVCYFLHKSSVIEINGDYHTAGFNFSNISPINLN